MLLMKSLIRTLLVCSLTFALFFAGNASAASICKGMEKNVCAKNDSCSWVDGYKTKTGTKVKSHCRKKPKKSAKKSIKKTPKKSTDKAKSKVKDKTKKPAKKPAKKPSKSKEKKPSKTK